MHPTQETYLTVAALATFLGIAHPSAWSLLMRGSIPYIVDKRQGCYLIRRADAQAYKHQRQRAKKGKV